MLSSRLTSKYQATIPKEVRKALHLQARDRIVYLLQGDDTVLIKRATPLDIEYLNAVSETLSEWKSEEDEDAFRTL